VRLGRTALAAVGLGILGLTLVGCGGSSNSSSGGNGAPKLRVVHAMPSVFVTVDVVQDASTTLFAQGVSYGNSTGYVVTTAASHTIVVEPSGSTIPLTSNTFTAAAGTDYTLIASGPSGNLTGNLLTDNQTAPPTGDFKLRVVNSSPSGGTIDVYATAPGADLSTAAPNASNLGFSVASSYLNLAAGTWEIRLTAHGSKSVEFDSGTLAFNNGQIRTMVALDAPGGGGPLGASILADVN
jgi:hypothetical protein